MFLPERVLAFAEMKDKIMDTLILEMALPNQEKPELSTITNIEDLLTFLQDWFKAKN